MIGDGVSIDLGLGQINSNQSNASGGTNSAGLDPAVSFSNTLQIGGFSISVHADAKARADFKAEVGLDVALKLSRTTSLADGYTVITGEVVTSQYGKPKASVQVSLRPKASVTQPCCF